MLSGAVRPAPRPTLFPAMLVLAGVAALCASVYLERSVAPVAVLLILLAALGAGYRFLARWEVTVALVVLVVLFIPIKRYQFAVSLPFDLEPYRILVALAVFLWVIALLVDPRVELRRSALDGPLCLVGLAVVGSVALNADTISGVGGERAIELSDNVAKELLFLLSFFLTFYFVVSVVRTPGAIHAVLKALVVGATVVAAFAILERRTRYNAFDHLGGWVPFLDFEGSRVSSRAGRLRVYGSAQHPIALGAMLVTILPISIYLAHQTRRRIWLVPTVLIPLAAMATVSRTGVVMLAVVGVVFVLFRPSILKVALIAALPALIAVHLVVPGAIGGLRQAFFPPEGIVEDQTVYGGRLSGRRLGPQFELIRDSPVFGRGYGTRVTSGPQTNAQILDDQWLATGVETGLTGVLAWLWLFVRFIRKVGSSARRDLSGRGWLLSALTASVAAFALGMLFFDAFSFIQATFVLFVLLAIGSSTLDYQGRWPERGSEATVSLGGGASVRDL